MTMTSVSVEPTETPKTPYLEWGPVIGGAITATAVSFLLLTFGSAVGLSATSPWPGHGISITIAAWAVLWWSILVQIGSFAAGGYLAGRMRRRWGDSLAEEVQFRDNAHGFLVWALGVLLGAWIVASAGGAFLKTATQATAAVGTGAAVGSAAKTADLATAPTDYAVDLLLRPAPRPGTTPGPAPAAATAPAPAPQRTNVGDDAALRSEAARIFAISIKNQEFTARNRDYLTQVVVQRTALSEDEAQKRVDAAMTEARDLELKVREQADKARKAAVLAGFLAAASLLISCVAACLAAALGGRHRDEGRVAVFFGHRFW
jgi:hypothetical protein